MPAPTSVPSNNSSAMPTSLPPSATTAAQRKPSAASLRCSTCPTSLACCSCQPFPPIRGLLPHPTTLRGRWIIRTPPIRRRRRIIRVTRAPAAPGTARRRRPRVRASSSVHMTVEQFYPSIRPRSARWLLLVGPVRRSVLTSSCPGNERIDRQARLWGAYKRVGTADQAVANVINPQAGCRARSRSRSLLSTRRRTKGARRWRKSRKRRGPVASPPD